MNSIVFFQEQTTKIRMKKVPWKGHEPTWIWHTAKNETEIKKGKPNRQLKPTFWNIFSMDWDRLYPGQAWMWKRHETAMKLPCKWHESDMILIFWDWKKVPWICHESDTSVSSRFGKFIALSWHFSKINCYNSPHQLHLCRTFSRTSELSGSAMKVPWNCWGSMLGVAVKVPWKCHESAMNHESTVPWQIHGTFNQTELQTVQVHGMFMAFYPQNYFKIVMSVLSCVCLSFYLIFIADLEFVKVFVFFLWSKYRVIRNTQTTKPNPQLVVTWYRAKKTTSRI